jgi:acetone carboxylase gamma subunit
LSLKATDEEEAGMAIDVELGSADALDAVIDGPPIGDAIALRRGEDGAVIAACAECGHVLGPGDRDPKLGAAMRERSIADLSPLNAAGMTERLVARFFHCPDCALLLAVNVQQVGDPIMLEWRLDLGAAAAGE